MGQALPEEGELLLVGGCQGVTQAVGLRHLSGPLTAQGKRQLLQVDLGLRVKSQTLGEKKQHATNIIITQYIHILCCYSSLTAGSQKRY